MESLLKRDDSLGLYLEQLNFLAAVGVLSKHNTSVFNVFSGIDFFPVEFAAKMFTLDRRISEDTVPEILSLLRTKVCSHLSESNNRFPLAANLSLEKNIIHNDSDIVVSGVPNSWRESMGLHSVLLLKQVAQYGSTFNGDECQSNFIANLLNSSKSWALVVVIENKIDHSSMAEALASDERYDNFLASRLTTPQMRRLTDINESISYKAIKIDIHGERFQLMLAGSLSVFSKRV
jgi:hypothetical protein